MKQRSIKAGDDWATPQDLYSELNKIYAFDFDPCPLKHNTGEWDGLKIEWGKSNFVNPPYSLPLKELFVKKAIEEANKGKLCVCLLPVSTSTRLFHDYILPNAKNIIFLRGRVKYSGVNSKGVEVRDKAGMHDSMLVVFHTTPPEPSRPSR